MTATLSPKEVLASIPGWESAGCTPLRGGLTNRAWRVVSGDRQGILKIDNEPRVTPFNSRRAEAQMQDTAAAAGLASKVILAGLCFYFTEYVDGVVWDPGFLAKDGNLETIAAALKRLHALPLTGRLFDASAAADLYLERIAGLPADVVENCTVIIASNPLPQDLCCCHNDLVVENLISTPDLMFLDWEYCCDNDPFFDLATLVEHHELGDSKVTALLGAYAGRDDERSHRRLAEQRTLYLALLYLWMGSRPDSDAAKLQEVAQRLTTSYS